MIDGFDDDDLDDDDLDGEPKEVGMAADVLCATVFEPPNYAVPGYIVEGLTLLAGKPKIGKSWLMLHVGIAVACGSFTLDDIHCVKGDVLYAALEDNKRRLQCRLRKLLNGRARPGAAADLERRRNAPAERRWDGADPGLDRAGAGAEAGRDRRAGQGARPAAARTRASTIPITPRWRSSRRSPTSTASPSS